jgi:transposase
MPVLDFNHEKHSPRRNTAMKKTRLQQPLSDNRQTVGIDLGDKFSHYCVLNKDGQAIEEGRLRTTRQGFSAHFENVPRMKIAVETGGHSAWVSQLLAGFGHEVIVADSRQIPVITSSNRKNDAQDAETLARLARFDPQLLHPIRHRNLTQQRDLALLRARGKLVEIRTTLINTVRSVVKGFGHRLPKCTSQNFSNRCPEYLPEQLREILQPFIELIAAVSAKIAGSDKAIEQLAEQRYSESAVLRSIPGVGPICSLAFVLTIADKSRFQRSRDVGAYLGLRPRRFQSGARDPQLRITKAGDHYLRKTLIQCAHYILGPFGPDSALRKWGLQLADRGGKNAKKRAIVAVARKLSVLLHHLWTTQERYQPFPELNVSRLAK